MEGLPYDFGIDQDSKDDGVEKKYRKSRTSILEALKDKSKSQEKPKVPSKESLLKTREEVLDNAPELDAEAPLKNLSSEEMKAVVQTIASKRLTEIRSAEELELTSQHLAAESFLENVEASGDINQAYNETLLEIGETASAGQYELESETALPVDPKSLLQDAKTELNADVYSKIDLQDNAPKPEQTKRSSKLNEGIVDYLIGRRFARIAAEGKKESIETRLGGEVSQLQSELDARESNIRQMAENRLVERKKKVINKAEETEAIGRVLIDSELPERPVGHRNEIAGISAHTMGRSELLRTATAIQVEGSSLKEIYETHLVGEEALRRIVAEYLRGGNYLKTLKQELIEREKDFERDPMLRDQASKLSDIPITSELDSMLQRSGIEWSDQEPTIKEPKAKSQKLPALLNDIKSPAIPLRRLLDIAMISVIVALAVVIIVLIFTK